MLGNLHKGGNRRVIVYRYYSVLDRGELDESVSLWRRFAEVSPPGRVRIYTALACEPPCTLCVEVEYDDLAQMEAMRGMFRETPIGQQLLADWTPKTEFGGRAEVWELVEGASGEAPPPPIERGPR